VPDTSKVALIIGVDSYHHKRFDGKSSLTQLPSCRNDAIDLYNLLSSEKFGYSIYENRLIIGSALDVNSSFNIIQSSIIRFFTTAQIGQTLLFYFSGHGIPREGDEIFLATPIVDPSEPMLGGFRISDLTKLVNTSRARQIVCIIDSCYSGTASSIISLLNSKSVEEQDQQVIDSAQSTSRKILDDILKNEGRYFLLSTQPYSRSYARKDNGNTSSNSIYTKYLLEGLKGVKRSVDQEGKNLLYTGSVDENGYVTPESLHRYASYKVTSEVPQQEPVIKSTISGDPIVIANYPELAPTPTTDFLLKLLYDNRIVDFNKRRDGNPFVFLNLSKQNLSRKNLHEANLSGLNLSGANLTNTDLSYANLSGANLTNADLSYANLNHAKLTDTNMSYANLSGADLTNADLSRTKSPYGKFISSKLCGAKIISSYLYRIDFTYADLSNAILWDAKLMNANLSNAVLTKANLSRANGSTINLAKSDLSYTNISRAHLWHANLSGADLTKADLSYANLSGANLSVANLSGADLSFADLTNTKLSSTVLTNALLTNTRMSNSQSSNANSTVEDMQELYKVKDMSNERLSIDLHLKSIVNINENTNYCPVGPAIKWSIGESSLNIDRVACRNEDGDLLVFSTTSNRLWIVENVSHATGRKVAAPLIKWQIPEKYTMQSGEYIASVSPDGDLLVFSFSIDKKWNVTVMSDKNNKKHDIVGPLTSWLIYEPEGFVLEHIAGQNSDGDLLEFIRSLRHPEVVPVYISELCKQKINGSVTNWQIPIPSEDYPLEYIASVSPDGDLLVFSWSPDLNWTVKNVSQITGKRISGSPFSWVSQKSVYVAAKDSINNLALFRWRSNRKWETINIPSSCRKNHRDIVGIPAVCDMHYNDDRIHFIIFRDTENHLILYKTISFHSWQVINLSDKFGLDIDIISDPYAWTISESDIMLNILVEANDQKNLLGKHRLLLISFNLEFKKSQISDNSP